MKKRMRKFTALLLSTLIICSLFSTVEIPVSAATISYEDSVGAKNGATGNCRWSLTDDGLLTISGNGYMADYSYSSKAPWGNSIKQVIIGGGVENIGSYSFYGCRNLSNITISDSVTYIGDLAFYYCQKITEITIPTGVTSIGESAFSYCTMLSSAEISNSVTDIGDYAYGA